MNYQRFLSKINYRTSVNESSLAILSFILFFSSDIIFNIYSKIFSILSIPGYQLATILTIYIPVLFIFALSKKLKAADFFVLLTATAILFLVSYIVHPQYDSWYFHEQYGVILRIFRPDKPIYAYLFVRLSRTSEELLKGLKAVGVLNFLYYFYTYIKRSGIGYWEVVNSNGEIIKTSYNLDFGYSVTFVAIIFAYFFFREKKKLYGVLFVICTFIVLAVGSRGSLLCLLIFFVLYFLSSSKQYFNKKRIAIIFFLGIIGIIIFAVSYKHIFSYIVNSLESIGISSRTLTSLAEGSISDGNGRERIYSLAIGMIKNGGIFGYGPYGDRYIIGQEFYWGYAHNIALEILITFGVIIGSIILIAFLFFSIRMLFYCRDEGWKGAFLIFFSCSCQLLLSSSFWYSQSFWACLAVVSSYYISYGNGEITAFIRKIFGNIIIWFQRMGKNNE